MHKGFDLEELESMDALDYIDLMSTIDCIDRIEQERMMNAVAAGIAKAFSK